MVCPRLVAPERLREDIAWSKPIDFYAFSCGSFRKKARNLIETAQRKSQGIMLILAMIVSYGLTFLLIGFISAPIVWIYAMVDANKTANRINAQMVSLGSGGLRDQLTGGA